MNYSTSKKLQARQDTILKMYENFTGLQKLPPNKQYWTMCAQCIEGENNPKVIKGSELEQIVSSGLISYDQFHGVDSDEGVWESNLWWYGSEWYHGDFYEILSWAADQPWFNPGIINVDTLHEPKAGIKLFSKILYRLRDYKDFMLVGNFILTNRSRKYEREEMVHELNKNPKFNYVYTNHNIQWDGRLYEYYGSAEHNRTKMGSIILFKKGIVL